MIQKKICMLGSYGVGKTSLVSRFISSIFSDRYLTTIGVKIEKKRINYLDQEVTLLIWDIAGADDAYTIPNSFIRGSAGYLLVIDGSRRSTLDVAASLNIQVENELGPIPFVVLINKSDLIQHNNGEWEIEETDIEDLRQRGWTILLSSAITGENVDDAFYILTHMIMEEQQ